jgi:hypothetical protein
LPILNIIKKLRTTNYLEDANVYLEANAYEKNRRSSGLYGLGFGSTTMDIQPFPEMNVHCGGYGSGNGLSDNNISTVWQAHNSNLKQFGNRCMKSLAGDFASFDHTYETGLNNQAYDINGNASNPIGAFYSGLYLYYMFICMHIYICMYIAYIRMYATIYTHVYACFV